MIFSLCTSVLSRWLMAGPLVGIARTTPSTMTCIRSNGTERAFTVELDGTLQPHADLDKRMQMQAAGGWHSIHKLLAAAQAGLGAHSTDRHATASHAGIVTALTGQGAFNQGQQGGCSPLKLAQRSMQTTVDMTVPMEDNAPSSEFSAHTVVNTLRLYTSPL